eukprot:GHVS01045443.1.p1 GENE.GHVS01045443.1~~GHVS01045443.1.p1  ORF type:complete len:551 (-),score=107.61 GHVS01045443.1:200-1663(-)
MGPQQTGAIEQQYATSAFAQTRPATAAVSAPTDNSESARDGAAAPPTDIAQQRQLSVPRDSRRENRATAAATATTMTNPTSITSETQQQHPALISSISTTTTTTISSGTTSSTDGVGLGVCEHLGKTTTVSRYSVEGSPATPTADGNATRPQGWDMATDKSHSSNRWLEAHRRLEKVKELLVHLERSMHSEFVDNDTYSASLEKAHSIHEEVTTTLHKCSTHINIRLQQLDECSLNYRLLTAESLPDCSNTSLDEISDSLSAGLQAATIALSRRQLDSKDIQPPQPNFEFYFKTMPEPTFDPPATPGMSETSGFSEPLSSQLIEQLQEIRTLQAHGYEDLQKKDALLTELQGQIREKNEHYGRERHSLERLDHKLDNKIRQVNRLSGKDSYSDMTPQLLSDLCRQINKASRRIATQQALRELRAANAMDGGIQVAPDKEICLVCFEKRWNTTLSPCGHVLCDDCGSRLNYCPQCRTKISGRNKCQQP